MKQFAVTAASLLGAFSLSVQAETTEISGVDVPETLEVKDTELVLNGGGERNRWFMKIYVASLYLEEPSSDAEAIISADQAKAITLDITSGMIDRDRMVDSVEEGFDQAMDGDTSEIQDHIDEMLASFDEEIDEGDLIELIYVPDDGVTVRHNGDTVGEVEGDDTFKEALFTIWLGEDPAQDSLKEDMLGQ